MRIRSSIRSLTVAVQCRRGTAMRQHADRRSQSGQTLVEFALAWGSIIVPLTFAIIFTSELLWIWHSVADFTREGARYAATHCWQGDGSERHVTVHEGGTCSLMPDQNQHFATVPRKSKLPIFRETRIPGSQ